MELTPDRSTPDGPTDAGPVTGGPTDAGPVTGGPVTGGRGIPPEVRRVAVLAFVGGTALALAFLVLRVQRMEIEPPPSTGEKPWHVFSDYYYPPESRLESALNIADGQAWAALGNDPTASDADRMFGDSVEFVYRAQRPLVGWVVWAASFGRPGAVPYALAAVTAASAGALAAASVVLADRVGRRAALGALVLLLPGVMLSVVILCPDALPVALAVAGVTCWVSQPRRTALAVGAFALAVLGRELLVLVPVALGAHGLWRREPLRRLIPLALSVVPLVVWVASLHARHGSWPWEAQGLDRLGAPFAGWAGALDLLDGQSVVAYLVSAGLIGVAVARHRSSPLTWIAVAFALSTVVMGSNVLGTEAYRPLLAMDVFALVAVLPPAAEPRPVRG